MSSEQPAAGGGAVPADRRFGLTELTRAAGVSVRTVRYYIAEGLLPPPVGGGPASHYTAAHLDRLRLIARLKAAYLPLKEIRRRLDGLDDAEIRRLVVAEQPTEERTAPEDDATAYLDRLLGARPAPTGPSTRPPAAPRLGLWGLHDSASPAADAPPAAGSSFLGATAHDPPAPPPSGCPPSVPMLGRAYPAAFPGPDPDTETADPVDDQSTHSDAWRRVPLGDDAELLIREGTYRRRQDRVEWLIAWARKVFG